MYFYHWSIFHYFKLTVFIIVKPFFMTITNLSSGFSNGGAIKNEGKLEKYQKFNQYL